MIVTSNCVKEFPRRSLVGGAFKAKKLKGFALFVFGLPQQMNLHAGSLPHLGIASLALGVPWWGAIQSKKT
jgi:hypothetical protein